MWRRCAVQLTEPLEQSQYLHLYLGNLGGTKDSLETMYISDVYLPLSVLNLTSMLLTNRSTCNTPKLQPLFTGRTWRWRRE